jgi:hypothetical protein
MVPSNEVPDPPTAKEQNLKEDLPSAPQSDLMEQPVVSEAHSESSDRERLWRYLVTNITRSIDELLLLCDEEKSLERCQKSIDLLVDSQAGFKQLICRLQSQPVSLESFEELPPLAQDASQVRAHFLIC